MAGINPDYVIAPSLEMYFVDNASGLPLAGGIVTFYSDVNRSTLKNVYELTGSSGNYSYVALPNPVTLSSVGTFQDNSGNNIVPYYWPWSDPVGSANPSHPELYYITVYNANGILQFTRQGWPNFSAETSGASVSFTNYVPNPQFLAHYNVNPANAVPGTITAVTTPIAPGGWYFQTSNNSPTDVDIVTFNEFTTAPSSPPGTPHFAVNVQCTSVGITPATFKYLVLQFNDVNQFAGQTMQLGFWGQSDSGSPLTMTMNLVQNFGTGTNSPSSPLTTLINQWTVATSYALYQTSFTFPNNSSKIIGNSQPPSDYMQIVLAFPTSALFNIEFTDFIIAPPGTNISQFPIITPDQMLSDAIAGYMPIPNPLGNDLYLPLRLSPTGLVFDHDEIGDIVAAGNLSNYSGNVSTLSNRLLANGAQYLTTGYSALGIPFSRLQAFYAAGGLGNVPQFGTGANFATGYIQAGNAPSITLTTNKVGSQSAAADGATPTHFTFNSFIAGSAGFNFVAYANGSTLVTAICNTVGAATNTIAAGTSGMTVADYRNNAFTYYAFNVTALSASALGNGAGTGKYFDFSNTSTRYRMWFQTATETAPANGGNTLVQLNLDLNMTAADVAKVLANAIAGFQVSEIICGAASTFNGGAYFTFVANSVTYVAWYTKSGVGTQPVVASATYIPIAVLSGDTATQVASKTQLAINSFYFAVPDLRGLSLRGADPTGEWDIDYLSRFSFANTLTGGLAGTMELDQVMAHLHTINALTTTVDGATPSTIGIGGGGSGGSVTPTENNYPGSESRPVNMAVVWAVRY